MVDIAVDQLTGFGLANVLPRGGKDAAAVGAALGFAVGHGPVTSAGDAIVLWGNAPGQWLAFAEAAAPDWAEALGEQLADCAGVVDQSSAYSLFRVTGAHAERLLQKGLPVDLAVLAPGAIVVSTIAHLGVIVQCAAPGSYTVAVFRSFTGSFRHWLDVSIPAL